MPPPSHSLIFFTWNSQKNGENLKLLMNNKVAYLRRENQYYKICKKMNGTGNNHYE